MALLRGRGGLRAQRSRLVLGLYVACTLLVFSFIFFEVLDVDASDFSAPTQAPSIKLVEPPHDLKRAAPSGTEGLVLPQQRTGNPDRVQRPVSPRSPLAVPLACSFRIALPRAALPDPSPSA